MKRESEQSVEAVSLALFWSAAMTFGFGRPEISFIDGVVPAEATIRNKLRKLEVRQSNRM